MPRPRSVRTAIRQGHSDDMILHPTDYGEVAMTCCHRARYSLKDNIPHINFHYPKIIPVVGTIRTNDRYGQYRCLVLRLPSIGTMARYRNLNLNRSSENVLISFGC
ncbi:MAG: hypothetical protein SPI30_08080 [Prevotella sp.]|nr:hypothetical protein [Prevotella sp.]